MADIHETDRTVPAMNASDHLQSITDAVPALISFFDDGHVCRYANDHHCRWYGRTPQELTGLHMREFLGEAGYALRKPFLERVAAGEQVSFDAKVPHLDGSWRDAAIRYVPQIAEGRFVGFHILVFDVAQHKHRFDSIFDGTAVAFWELDLGRANALFDSRRAVDQDPGERLSAEPALLDEVLGAIKILSGNDKAALLFGLPRDRAVGSSLGAFCPEASRTVFADLFTTYLRGETGFEAETVMMSPEGQLLDVLVTCAFPRETVSRDTLVLGVSDIRTRVAKERELARAQSDLAHAARVATLGELMASIAHEVNQPLAAVVANGNAARRWLSRAEPNIEEAKAAIQSMIEEGERASLIIARTRAMAVKRQPEREPFPLNVMIRETIDLVARQLAGMGASIRLDLADDLPELLGDRVQLQQVLINLVVNAGQAMADQTDAPREVTVHSALEGEMAVVAVGDTGPGISADQAGQLFNAFYTTKATGMGMGLSVAKTIVEAHGGMIAISQARPRGAVFRFTAPLQV